ncbi:hypothetical protein [Phenylobacterium sp.]|uniref:hypothetical protein n=1 Tax=Phenylobacterium sp. TaxID=1871053 RepID=UPI002BF4BA32|nr:hypothetical protein [Phenylobacterium sp.]HVI34472.1 hypothetical protein [Phenylobacterium sp.]
MPKKTKHGRKESVGAAGAALGRVFSVRRETWRLDQDPSREPPEVTVLTSRRSAAEAADVARDAVSAFRKRGFHKPTRSWWGAADGRIHRFRVEGPRARATLFAVGVGLAAAAVLLARRRRQ